MLRNVALEDVPKTIFENFLRTIQKIGSYHLLNLLGIYPKHFLDFFHRKIFMNLPLVYQVQSTNVNFAGYLSRKACMHIKK